MAQEIPTDFVSLPETLPVIVLEGCNLFPHGILPLYIFEPRYREMLASALDSDRMFCVATVQIGGEMADPGPEQPVFQHSTAGLIRACVGNEDGTSNLILQGIQRIRFTGWPQAEPFCVATIEEVATVPFSDEAMEKSLAGQLRQLVGELFDSGVPVNAKLRESIEQVEDPEILADLVAYNFVPSIDARQHLLEMASLRERFEFLLERLRKMRELLVD